MADLSGVTRAFADRFVRRGRRTRRRGDSALATIESLESRLALFSPFPIQVTQIPSGSGATNGLYIQYSQGGAITADQHVVIDIDRVFTGSVGVPQTRVNVYASTNPAANPSTPGTAYTNIDYIRIEVPNFDVAGTNNNSLTIKGIALPTDRIIISGSGRTAAGRWSDESGSELQVAFDIEGIDDTTVTAGGVINVSGAFTNDTGDASIHAIGEIAERSTDQQTATVIVGETTPADPNVLPHPRLVSDFVEIVGAELDIYSDIVASRQVILRAAESAPGDSRSNLVLPYDITVMDPTNGVLELHSTRNITQLQSSTINARKVVAVSNNSNPIPPATGLDGNPWNIDLGSTNNDFDEIALGMIAAPGDDPNINTQGRIGVRDIDDLRVADFGILALTGQVTVRTGGQLTFDSSVQARGLVAQSDFGITSTTKADMRILGVPNNDANAAGDIVLMANNSAAGATGDITLNARVDLGDRNYSGTATSSIYNIRTLASGTTTIAGGLYSPVSTQLLVESDEGIVISSPVQMGSTIIDALSKSTQVFRGGISLVSNGVGSNGITILNRPGNPNGPQTVNASEAISLESTGDITINGAVLSGTVYGNPSSLNETAALPSITVKTPGSVSLSSTGSLQTVAYGTNPGTSTNPLLGLISISNASQVTTAGRVTADGAVDIDVVGDVSLAGPTTARENVSVATSAGSIDVQAPVYSEGGTYTVPLAAGSQRVPNVILSAPNGSISTSNLGTLRAGTATAGGTATYGTVILDAQQDIEIGAAIDTDGGVDATTKLGSFNLSALLRTANAQTANITAANGVTELEFGRIVSESLRVTNTTAGDITLLAVDNRISELQAKNFAPAGEIKVLNNSDIAVTAAAASGDISVKGTSAVALTDAASDANVSVSGKSTTITNVHAGKAITAVSDGLLSLVGDIIADDGDVTGTSTAGGIDLRANVQALGQSVVLTAKSGVAQQTVSGVTRVDLLNPGRLVSNAPNVEVTIAAPQNGGRSATAFVELLQTGTTTITTTTRDSDGNTTSVTETFAVWTIRRVVITDPGVGYSINESPRVTFSGISGVLATAFTRTFDTAVSAGDSITVTGDLDIKLFSPFIATNGDMSVTSNSGNLDLSALTFFAQSRNANVNLTSKSGEVLVERIQANTDITIEGKRGVTVERSADAGQDIVVTAKAGSASVLRLSAGRDTLVTAGTDPGVLYALTANDVRAGNDVAMQATGPVILRNQILADQGTVSVTSAADSIYLDLANIESASGDIALNASGVVSQPASSGIARLELLSRGQVIAAARPEATVTIAAPAGGGTAATAVAIVDLIGWAPDDSQVVIPPAGTFIVVPANTTPIWGIVSLTVTNPGSGYAPNEIPLVTFTGVPNAIAAAVNARAVPTNILADGDVTINGGDDVRLSSTVRSDSQNVFISSKSGDLDLGADTFFAHAIAGEVTLTSLTGNVIAEKVFAASNIAITGQQGVDVENEARSENGDITITSSSGEINVLRLNAGQDVVVAAGDTVTVLGAIDSDTGDVSLTSRNRDLDFTASGAQLHARQGGVALTALNGTIMSPPTLHAAKDVSMTSFNTLVLNNEITSETGVIALKSTSGSINLGANINANVDSVQLSAKGSITQIGGGIGFVRVTTGGSGYTTAATVTIAAPSGGGVAARAVPIIGTVRGVSGVITGIRLTSPGSGYGAGEQPAVTFTRNATPPTGAAFLNASAVAVAAPALGNSGLAAIDVMDGGSGYGATTTVTIAAPAGGGTAATAQAVIGTVVADDGTTRTGVILDIVIVNSGSGYGAGEQPAVTIAGAGTGAVARAIANITLQDIRAGNKIDISAGTGVTLLNTIRADVGPVNITTEAGNVNLAARTLLVSSYQDKIGITARRGAITAQRLAADGDINLSAQTGVTLLNAVNSTGDFGVGNVSMKTVNGNIAAVAPNGLISVQNGGVSLESVNGSIIVPQVFNVSGDVSLKSFASQTIEGALTSSTGDVTVSSSNGSVTLAANVRADDRITLSARQGISQRSGFIKATELVATNATTKAVALTNSSNDVSNLSILSLGAVAYTDANSFEVGVNRTAPLGVEVGGDSVQLSSAAPFSTIRVVSGLRYNSLSIAAGTQSGTTVGTVEFVPTSNTDNPLPAGKVPTFAGTLRDMIRYVNDNTAVYTLNQTNRSQPMALVFDEAGFPVSEITLSSTTALPTFNRAVTFDGGRLEDTVLTAGQTRLGITVAAGNSLPYGLSFAPAIKAVPGKSAAFPGSGGSRIEDVAIYGFTKGSALVLGSANNTVSGVYAGLMADGTSSKATQNLVGVDVTGTTATSNTIGSTVFDVATVNRFGGNTSAGILIRNGASGTKVYGSIIGDDTGVTPTLANGDGIRITGSTGNLIGAPDKLQPDQTDSISNIIAGNTATGISIVNATAGTLGGANVIRNNLLSGNRVGVNVTGSRFTVLGDSNGEAANVIVSSKADGVSVTNSQNIQLFGNLIGITPATSTAGETVAGNAGNGVAITGTSQNLQISAGNRISGNRLNGIAIGTGVTSVTITGNTIGGLLDDGLTAAGNLVDGVAINAAVGNTIGAGNTISRNGRHGVSVVDARAATLTAGNRIFGSTVSDNVSNGIYVGGGSNSTIGGTTAGLGNIIQSNGRSGIYLERSARTGVPTGFAIQGNFVGTNANRDVDAAFGNLSGGIVVNDATGVRIEGNTVMNNLRANDPNNANDPNDGITLRGGSGNVVGGTSAAFANLVAFNDRDGIRVVGASAARAAQGHSIMGNVIVDNGTAGAGNGVTVTGAFARNITIGQSVTTAGVRGLGNVIQRNTASGVAVAGGAQQVSIQGNAISENVVSGKAIAAGSNTSSAAGITLNRATIRQPSGSQLQILLQGQITGAVRGQQYSVDVYANSAEDSDYGGFQARRFLGRVTVTATANGSIVWNATNPLTISANVAVGEVITATVTSLRVEPGSTSNLSAGVVASR